MIKRFILFVLLLAPLCLAAETVPPERAKRMAGNVLSAQGCWSRTLTQVVEREALTKSTASDPAYYIFKGDRGGFVITSADDRLTPVLGWSASGDIDGDDIPDNLRSWLCMWSDALERIRNGIQLPQVGARQEWETFEMGRIPMYATEKQYETAKWNQEEPFNKYCPQVDGKPCAAGCTAVATSIVMRYHEWPQAGTGVLPEYYYQDDDGTPRMVPAQPLGNVYKWDAMPMVLHSYDDDEEAKEQVARLIADVGIALQSTYNPGGTGAYTSDIVDVLPRHFFYDASMAEYYLPYYTYGEWTGMLMDNLDKVGPLVYSGSSPKEGGHAFVVDGYNTKGQFSINWGWGGKGNGFFTFPDFDDFKLYNTAVLGIKKDEGGTVKDFLYIDGNGSGSGLTSTTKDFKVGEPFSISCMYIYNLSQHTFTGRFILAVVHRDGSLGEVIDDGEGEEDDLFTLEPLNGIGLRSDDCVLTEEPQIGDRLCMFFRSENNPELTLITGNKEDGTPYEIPIADASYLDEVTSFRYTSNSGSLVITTKKDAQWKVEDAAGTIYTEGIEFANGELTIQTKQFPYGSYFITLSKGDNDRMSVEFVFGSKEVL